MNHRTKAIWKTIGEIFLKGVLGLVAVAGGATLAAFLVGVALFLLGLFALFVFFILAKISGHLFS